MRGNLGLVRGGVGQQARAHHDGRGASQNLHPLLRAGAPQFVEQQPAPKQSHQAVGVPQRKGDGEADVPDRKDGERVGDGPQHSGQDGPDDQVRLFLQVREDIAGALEQGRHGPAGHKHTGHHADRDHEGRKANCDELGWRFGGAQPGAGSQAADHTKLVQGAGREHTSRFRGFVHGFTA